MDLPPKELLESTHQFPTRYVFKAVGPSTEAFSQACFSAVAGVAPPGALTEHSRRASASGRHTSLTLHVDVACADEVLAIYAALSRVEGLVFLM